MEEADESTELKDPGQINADTVDSVSHETSRHVKNKKQGCLKGKMNEFETDNTNMNVRDLYLSVTLGILRCA